MIDDDFRNIMQRNDLRLTQPRIKLYYILKEQHAPISLGEINKLAINIERTSVYRALLLFQKIGVVQVVPYGWKQRYELAEPFVPHHHHLLCGSCGSITAIDSSSIENLVAAISKKQNFKPLHHHFEIKGMCQDCELQAKIQ